MPTDEQYMQRALRFAESTVGLASPNPQVGCVLVGRDGHTLGEGAHRYDQRDHAEIVALNVARSTGQSTRGATAYVTLEPCSHHGRTGPCADALIGAGIARCLVATVDPNPAVSGRGIDKLRMAGIEVNIGLEQARARRINEAFALSITERRPFVTLKAGLSVDGRLAPLPESRVPGQPYWLTGPQSRAEVHRLRHGADAILTGIGTALADHPLLTDRSGLPRRRPLMRVVLDSRLHLPLDSPLVRSAQDDLWLFCGPGPSEGQVAALSSRGVRITRLGSPSSLDLTQVLEHLDRAGIRSVLLEAGSTLNGAFLQADLVDRATFFYAQSELGPDSLPFAMNGPTPFAVEERMLHVTKQSFGDDVCVSGLLRDPWATVPEIV